MRGNFHSVQVHVRWWPRPAPPRQPSVGACGQQPRRRAAIQTPRGWSHGGGSGTRLDSTQRVGSAPADPVGSGRDNQLIEWTMAWPPRRGPLPAVPAHGTPPPSNEGTAGTAGTADTARGCRAEPRLLSCERWLQGVARTPGVTTILIRCGAGRGSGSPSGSTGPVCPGPPPPRFSLPPSPSPFRPAKRDTSLVWREAPLMHTGPSSRQCTWKPNDHAEARMVVEEGLLGRPKDGPFV